MLLFFFFVFARFEFVARWRSHHQNYHHDMIAYTILRHIKEARTFFIDNFTYHLIGSMCTENHFGARFSLTNNHIQLKDKFYLLIYFRYIFVVVVEDFMLFL